jgi:glycosyltransferase involved in cell wall biosynthesis
MPRVSVLLTCFNHFAYLPAALEGVRRQSYRDFEIVAIDDGSKDETRDWLAKQPDVRCIFNETNIGTYATLNVGLRATDGEFVAVLNDDDLWEPDKLKRQIELLDSNPDVGLVHTGGAFIDGKGDRQESYFGSGDWEMWFRIAEQCKVGFVDEPLTYYRVHGANASHKLERIWRDDERLRDWITERLANVDPSRFPAEELRKAKAFNQAALGTVRTLNGNPSSGRAAYAQSIRMNPGRLKSYARYAATFLPRSTFRKLL